MQIIFQDADRLLARLDLGEEFFTAVKSIFFENNIPAATFTAIGACSAVELGYYDLAQKKYAQSKFSDELEILSLSGNIAQAADGWVLHAHGSFGRKDLSVLGGHVFSLTVAGTCEISFQILPEAISRATDPATGLNLLTPRR